MMGNIANKISRNFKYRAKIEELKKSEKPATFFNILPKKAKSAKTLQQTLKTAPVELLNTHMRPKFIGKHLTMTRK